MFSVIAVFNNQEVVNKYLLPGLKKQNAGYELILLDNRQKKYKSAAQALNKGFEQSKEDSKYIIFIHQDVELPAPDWLSQAESYLDDISDVGIAGVAGMVDYGENNKQRGRGFVRERENLNVWQWSNKIMQAEKVQTIDECVIIIPRSVFMKLKFDEAVCDHWHLYAVDYSLSVKKIKSFAYALPLTVNHHSRGGVADKYYYRCLMKVLKKHKSEYKRIYTTCGDFSTRLHLYLQKPGLILKNFA